MRWVKRFLQYTRRKLNHPLLATPDDQYSFSKLHLAYAGFLTSSQCNDIEDWGEKIQEFDAIIQNFPVDENGFVIDQMALQAAEVYTTIRNLINLCCCSNCCEILSFNVETNKYFCDRCQLDNEPVSLVANWHVY